MGLLTESDNAVEVNKMNVSSRLKKFKILKGGLAIARRIESIIGEQCMNVKTGAPLYFSDVRGINKDAFDFEPNSHITILKAIR